MVLTFVYGHGVMIFKKENKMKRIGFVGVPGAGKTSTARALAAFCRGNEFKRVELVSEYARRFLSKYGKMEHLSEQYRITEKQIEWEDTVPQNNTDLLITDSPIFLGFLYAMEFRNVNSIKDTMYINDLFKRLNKANIGNRYDLIFFLPPIIEPIKDGVRPDLHFDPIWREKASNDIKFIFNIFPPKNFVILEEKTIEDRVKKSIEYMKNFL